jgi:hypothetical protein
MTVSVPLLTPMAIAVGAACQQMGDAVVCPILGFLIASTEAAGLQAGGDVLEVGP